MARFVENQLQGSANFLVITQPVQVSLQLVLEDEPVPRRGKRPGAQLLISERQARPVESDVQRMEIRKNGRCILPAGGSGERLDPPSVLILRRRFVAFPSVAKEEYIRNRFGFRFFDEQ